MHPLSVRALAFSGKISDLRTWTIPPFIGLDSGGIAITWGTATFSAREGSSGASGTGGRGEGLTTQAAWSRGWAWVASDPQQAEEFWLASALRGGAGRAPQLAALPAPSTILPVLVGAASASPAVAGAREEQTEAGGTGAGGRNSHTG